MRIIDFFARRFAGSATSLFASLGLIVAIATVGARADEGDGKLRIICFGAHPDDCELQAGGVGAMWAERGHHVKFVSVTNGDIGHWRDAGGPLAIRRKAEVEGASEILGTTVEVLDIHDGELEPTLDNRKKIIRLIREWRADVVLAPRTNDYHPDHRYTGVLVQDASFMVAVPFITPDVPPLKKNPVFLYYTDRFQRPNPSRADIVVSIDSVIEKKIDALSVMESQFLEGGALGSEKQLPTSPEDRLKRVAQMRTGFGVRFARKADEYREELKGWYGHEAGAKVRHAEAFEVAEYGAPATEGRLKELFPFFD